MSGHATVNPTPNFNVKEDAHALRKALNHLIGCDDKALIAIIGSRTGAELKQVAHEYKVEFGRILHDDLKSKTSFHFQDALLGHIQTRTEFDAWALHHAIAGAGTDDHALIEILCTRNNAEIAAIRAVYKETYGKELEDHIIGDTSGHFKRLLVSLVQGAREENVPPNLEEAQRDAKILYEAGEAHWGTDESKFNEMLVVKSRAQIKLINEDYLKIKGQDLITAIDAEMSHNLKGGMLAITHSSINMHEYFADKLYHSMKGVGTDDRTLVRIIVSRCEVDTVEIKAEFAARHHKSLAKFITEDCSGDYKHFLVQLVGLN